MPKTIDSSKLMKKRKNKFIKDLNSLIKKRKNDSDHEMEKIIPVHKIQLDTFWEIERNEQIKSKSEEDYKIKGSNLKQIDFRQISARINDKDKISEIDTFQKNELRYLLYAHAMGYMGQNNGYVGDSHRTHNKREYLPIYIDEDTWAIAACIIFNMWNKRNWTTKNSLACWGVECSLGSYKYLELDDIKADFLSNAMNEIEKQLKLFIVGKKITMLAETEEIFDSRIHVFGQKIAVAAAYNRLFHDLQKSESSVAVMERIYGISNSDCNKESEFSNNLQNQQNTAKNKINLQSPNFQYNTSHIEPDNMIEIDLPLNLPSDAAQFGENDTNNSYTDDFDSDDFIKTVRGKSGYGFTSPGIFNKLNYNLEQQKPKLIVDDCDKCGQNEMKNDFNLSVIEMDNDFDLGSNQVVSNHNEENILQKKQKISKVKRKNAADKKMKDISPFRPNTKKKAKKMKTLKETDQKYKKEYIAIKVNFAENAEFQVIDGVAFKIRENEGILNGW